MVAINKIVLLGYTCEGCGGETRNPLREARLHACSPVHFLLSPCCRRGQPTRNYRRAVAIGRWMVQGPAQFVNGANTYQFVNSSPVGNVDAEGLFHRMSGEEMNQLAPAVENKLWAVGAAATQDGWTRLGAAAFVSYELNTERSGHGALEIGINLITGPIGAATGGGPSVKKIAKGVGKHALKQYVANRRVQQVDQRENEVWYWTGKVKNEATGCMQEITANLYIVYDENTETFTGMIDGSVGVLANAEGQPKSSYVFHTFHYPFSGAIKLAPAFFGLPIIPLGQQFKRIKAHSWRY